MPTQAASAARPSRIDLRASREEERVIRLAAAMHGETLSSFILKSACNEAEIALADQRHFALPPKQYERLVAALDCSARSIPALRKLFSERSVLENSSGDITPSKRK
ncbi:MAG TPA: DUF1778 domain-containing protein [Terriglobales bacterium]|nr:DUF1778 domain-containing protein [Terriglobales bacterium]